MPLFPRMGARHYTELIVWQLGDEIRIEVFRLTSGKAFQREFKMTSQLNDAANSICRNVAEGFSTGSDPAFARYLKISRCSLNELMDSLRGSQLQRLVPAGDLVALRALARREFKALSSLIAYLRGGDEKGPSPPRRRP